MALIRGSIMDAVRAEMREQLSMRLSGKYSFARESLQQAYTNAIDNIATERCFLLMEDAGLVMLARDPDDHLSMDDLFGDSFDPVVNSDMNPNVLKKQREEAERRVELEGTWFMEASYRDPGGDGWHSADSIGGFVGEDFWGSGYESDLWTSAMDGYADQFGAPHYKNCHPDPLERGPVFLAALRMCGAPLDIDPYMESRYLHPA